MTEIMLTEHLEIPPTQWEWDREHDIKQNTHKISQGGITVEKQEGQDKSVLTQQVHNEYRSEVEVEPKCSHLNECRNHDMVKLVLKVVKTGKHNSATDGLNININKQWNTQRFEQLLTDIKYNDMEVIQHLKYRWPVNRNLKFPNPRKAEINHKGALEFKQDITKYLNKEILHGRIAGPYEEIPFNNRIGVSPLSS